MSQFAEGVPDIQPNQAMHSFLSCSVTPSVERPPEPRPVPRVRSHLQTPLEGHRVLKDTWFEPARAGPG